MLLIFFRNPRAAKNRLAIVWVSSRSIAQLQLLIELRLSFWAAWNIIQGFLKTFVFWAWAARWSLAQWSNLNQSELCSESFNLAATFSAIVIHGCCQQISFQLYDFSHPSGITATQQWKKLLWLRWEQDEENTFQFRCKCAAVPLIAVRDSVSCPSACLPWLLLFAFMLLCRVRRTYANRFACLFVCLFSWMVMKRIEDDRRLKRMLESA